jgi:hypothetical protein
VFGTDNEDVKDKLKIYITGLFISKLLIFKIVYYCIEGYFPLHNNTQLAGKGNIILEDLRSHSGNKEFYDSSVRVIGMTEDSYLTTLNTHLRQPITGWENKQ